MDWKKQIAGCFSLNQIFAGHPMDENRAFDLLARLRKEMPPWKDVIAAFEEHLKGCEPAHIEQQIKDVSRHFEAWMR